MKPYDTDLQNTHEWRATFYNAEDVAENGSNATIKITNWADIGDSPFEQKVNAAKEYADILGFDTFEIEVRKTERTIHRFNTNEDLTK